MDDEAKLTLHGLQQHYVNLKENEKNKKLFELLDVLEFNQVIQLNPTLFGALRLHPSFNFRWLSSSSLCSAVRPWPSC